MRVQPLVVALSVIATGIASLAELALNRNHHTVAEIHCKHFFYGYPSGTQLTNDLIIRDIYALSSNDQTKLADWVAYRLDRGTITGTVALDRRYRADPWLEEEETLEPRDYRDANATLQVDRGHQAPLASFKGTLSGHAE